MSKKILVLGSTGNLGRQVLDVLKKLKEYKVVGLTTYQNVKELNKQARMFKPNFVVVADKTKADRFKIKNCVVYAGEKGLSQSIIKEKVDCIFNALSGTVGIMPTITAIQNRKNVFTANKESLVATGNLFMKEVNKYKINLLPVDSEHSAIFQCLVGEKIEEINKVILTCSGGYSKNKKNPTIDDLMKNSKWNMGEKITVDSATLMNKGFEVIEAQILFNLPIEKIDVVIHPEAIIHSMVEFCDGNIKAILGPIDMGHPILYALGYPKRKEIFKEKLQFNNLKLTFSKPDFQKFPCLSYGYRAAKIGGTMPAALISADEIAVKYYLKNKINFLDIPKIINEVVNKHKTIRHPTLNDILMAIKRTKQRTEKLIEEGYIK